jgi:hypothetical protein
MGEPKELARPRQPRDDERRGRTSSTRSPYGLYFGVLASRVEINPSAAGGAATAPARTLSLFRRQNLHFGSLSLDSLVFALSLLSKKTSALIYDICTGAAKVGRAKISVQVIESTNR